MTSKDDSGIAIAKNPAQFQYNLTTLLKIGQPGGITPEMLFNALMQKQNTGNTSLIDIAEYQNTQSFQYLLTALRIGQPDGISTQQLLVAFPPSKIRSLNGARRGVLHKALPQDDNKALDLRLNKPPFGLKNILLTKESNLSDDQKNQVISRDELKTLLFTIYDKHRNNAWHNSFWKKCDQDGSKTISQLKELLTNDSAKIKFSLLEIRAAIHRKSINENKDSGTNLVLYALMDKFNVANIQNLERRLN